MAYTEANKELGTVWQPNGNQMAPQVRLGKVRLGKVNPTEKIKETFEEYMSNLGYEPYELIQDDMAFQTYQTPSGLVMSPNKLQGMKRDWYAKYKPEVKVVPKAKSVEKITVVDVFRLFEDINPASESWMKIPTYRQSAQTLLDKGMSLDQMQMVIEFAQLHKDDEYCPKIRTPHDLLQKLSAIADYQNKKKKINVGTV
jgi:hypothetical protein